MATRAAPTERSRRTRADLAVAVHDCVGQTGALDVAAVAEAAGVSTATFYAHFDSHDSALAAALDLSLEAVIGVSNRLFTVENLLDRGVELVVGDLVREVIAAFRVEALVMRAALARLPHHKGLRDVYRRREAGSHQHLARHVALGQKAGLIRPGDPDQRVTALLVLTQGLNNPLLLDLPPDGAVIEDLARAIVAVLVPWSDDS